MSDKEDVGWKPKLVRTLDGLYMVIYVTIAIFLIAMAFASFVFVGKDLWGVLGAESPMLVILMALKDLFIAIIIVELLLAVVVFIREEQIDMRLLLGAGLTAMVRKVLVFGVEEVNIMEMVVVVALIMV
ncbi:MAG: phosphate-starvation-inducible PsiE family protein, partial [Euryarchaeota archaeon]|nr:phosphate-starvation-inducible PsiE family protein [Euryarchaeota archaeon]